MVFVAWIWVGDNTTDTENKPIKKVTEIKGLYLFGKRKVWTIDKSEEFFNSKGQLTEHLFYNNDGTCESKYLYKYTSFDSLEKIIWLTGEHLTPQQIEIWTYDSSKRKNKKLLYEITNAKIQPDTFLYEKEIYQYDTANRLYKTTSKSYYSESIYIKTYTFNYEGFIISDTFYTESKYDTSTDVTNYTYNSLGHIRTEFGGLSHDSMYYQTDSKGRIIEKKEQYGNFVRTCNKYWYDERGNQIKSFLDINDGYTYEYKYDKNNRLLKEYRAGGFLFILKYCVIYKYEYYEP